MTRVTLSGYPEAVLGSDSISMELRASALAGDVVVEVATRHPKLRSALLHDDGRPRRSTKVLVGGTVVDPATPVSGGRPVTVLAALPCDG